MRRAKGYRGQTGLGARLRRRERRIDSRPVALVWRRDKSRTGLQRQLQERAGFSWAFTAAGSTPTLPSLSGEVCSSQPLPGTRPLAPVLQRPATVLEPLDAHQPTSSSRPNPASSNQPMDGGGSQGKGPLTSPPACEAPMADGAGRLSMSSSTSPSRPHQRSLEVGARPPPTTAISQGDPKPGAGEQQVSHPPGGARAGDRSLPLHPSGTLQAKRSCLTNGRFNTLHSSTRKRGAEHHLLG